MEAKAIKLIDFIALPCVGINLGRALIEPSLGGAIAIVYGDHEGVAADNHNGSTTA